MENIPEFILGPFTLLACVHSLFDVVPIDVGKG